MARLCFLKQWIHFLLDVKQPQKDYIVSGFSWFSGSCRIVRETQPSFHGLSLLVREHKIREIEGLLNLSFLIWSYFKTIIPHKKSTPRKRRSSPCRQGERRDETEKHRDRKTSQEKLGTTRILLAEARNFYITPRCPYKLFSWLSSSSIKPPLSMQRQSVPFNFIRFLSVGKTLIPVINFIFQITYSHLASLIEHQLPGKWSAARLCGQALTS